MIDEKRIADFFCGAGIYRFAVLRGARDGGHLKIKFAEIGVRLQKIIRRSRPAPMRAICSRAFRAALQEPRFSLRPTWTLLSLQKEKKPSPMRMEP